MDNRIVNEWGLYLRSQNERTEALIASELDPEVKRHYMAAFADGNRMLAQLDEYGSRLEEKAPPQLVDQVCLFDYAGALMDSKKLNGAAAELNSELKLPVELGEGNIIPVPLSLMAKHDLADERHFADAVTTLSSGAGSAPQNRDAIQQALFKNSVIGFLGLSMPSVAFGEQEYPFVSSGPSAAAVAEGSGQDAGALALTIVTAALKTVAAGVVIGAQSLKRYGQAEIESLIRDYLVLSILDQMNNYVINGTGSGNQPKGILPQISTAVLADGDTGATDDDSAMTWADAHKAVYAHRSDPEMFGPVGFKFLLGLDSDSFLHGLFRSTTGEIDAIANMRNAGAAVTWSGHMPAAVAATSAAGKKQSAILMSDLGSDNCIIPTWEAFALQYDPYTLSKNQQVAFRAYTMFDLAYRRSTNSTIEGAKKLTYVISDKS